MTALDLVVFDMAGTTVVDDGQVPGAFEAALRTHGIDVTPDQLHRVRGSSKREAVQQFFPRTPDGAEHAVQVYSAFQEELAQRYAEQGVRAITGAEDAFAALRRKGVRVALATGFDRSTTELLINALGWTDHVLDAVVCGDDVPAGRPAPYLIFRAMEATGARRVQAVASVGDTALDLQAGANAGVRWNIGVLSGAHGREHLEAAPYTHIITSVALLETVFADVGYSAESERTTPPAERTPTNKNSGPHV